MDKKLKEEEDTAKMADYIAQLRRSSRNRESYDEIAELEAELRRAYMTKELEAQLVEREAERCIADIRKQQAAKLMRLEQQAALEDDLLERSEKVKKSADYGKELTAQMKRKEEERNMTMEEAREEREVLTEIDRIREQRERSRTLKMKNELANSIRRERLILEEMKLIRCQESMEAEAKKDLEDEVYLREIDQRAIKARQFREEQLEKRERVIDEIAKMLISIEIQKREKETLMHELIAEDVKFELSVREEEEKVRRKRTREELAANLEEQIVFTERCKLRFVERDRAFAEEIMRKIMEDERTARLTAQAKRRMQLQYREDLTRLIEIRRKMREKEILNMEEAAREETRRETIRWQRVREERKRLLAKHASNVADFIRTEREVNSHERSGRNK
ncbi:PREDICTED: meiosis-specific nuclear structural protein 1, partial [Habropoda laboriosa]|uniref:meiosis-specific nuclear structural protein 1 n=1 Tax=Habropoda laboriosa TaxID=597456 RepID=UPI00083DD5D8